VEDGRREGGSIYICFGSTTLYYFYLFRCCSLIDVISAARKAGVVHVYIATIYPAQHPQYTSELQSLLNRVPGARSLSNIKQMKEALSGGGGVTAGSAAAGGVAGRGAPPMLPLNRYRQSLIEQELCTIAHSFLGSDGSTWTGNVELMRSANGKPSTFFGNRHISQ